jgi:hypothetical protein
MTLTSIAHLLVRLRVKHQTGGEGFPLFGWPA